MKLQLFFFAVLLANIASAQTDCRSIYDKESIYLRYQLFKGQVFVKDNKAMPVGMFFNRLAPEMEQSSKAMPLFKKAQRNAKIAFGLNMVGLATLGVGMAYVLKSQKNGYLVNQQYYERGFNLILAGSVFSMVTVVPLSYKTQRQLSDAIHLRNSALFR